VDEEDLLDKIYEAGAIPELWPDILEEFGRLGDTSGGLLFTVRGDQVHWTASQGIHDICAGYFGAGYPGRDDRTARLLALNHPGFVVDLDVFTLREWEADPIRREYFAPRGFGWGIATAINVPNGDLLIFHGERKLELGPVGQDAVARLDRLRPHLARAALLSTRVAFERVVGAVAALEIVGIPAAVLDHRGQAIATNRILDELTPAIVLSRPSRLALADATADVLLAATMETLKDGLLGAPQSIPVPATETHPPMVVHVHPIRGQARDIFTSASAIILITPVASRDLPSANVIQGLFDLTPAEARVARALGAGITINELSTTSGASIATIRNQVRSVFAKTGMHRQAELVGLLQGLSPGASEASLPSPLPPHR
jgi:DNA-binding CsgD family transcriptional regulator